MGHIEFDMDARSNDLSKTPSETETACCKVERTATAFDIEDVGAELVDRRRRQDSYRAIAEHLNVRVIEAELDRADVTSGRSVHAALVGEDVAEAVYRVLRTDSGSDIRRAELRARLSEAGIDVDRLESAFVSHVTIRSHLQNCVSVDPDRSPPSFEQTVNTTQWAQTRASNVVQSALDRAVKTGQLQTGDLEAELFVRVTCGDCGDTFYLTELLESRSCSCSEA